MRSTQIDGLRYPAHKPESQFCRQPGDGAKARVFSAGRLAMSKIAAISTLPGTQYGLHAPTSHIVIGKITAYW